VGRVEAGRLNKGETLFLLPEKKKVAIKSIKKFLTDQVTAASFEESIGISLEGRPRVRRGQILAADLSSKISDTITANIFWMDPAGFQMGEPLLFRCVTQEVPCQIEKIYRRFDPAAMEWVEKDASSIKGAEVAHALIRLDAPVVVDSFNDVPEMGRFVLEKEGHPVAGGIIL
jgi:sulfate adenylyltransferase subunit 1 (EFTu-like GTPase family)